MTRPLNVAVVMVTLVIIVSWASFVGAQRQQVDQKVVDPQAAVKAAAAAFKQAKPDDNFRDRKSVV